MRKKLIIGSGIVAAAAVALVVGSRDGKSQGGNPAKLVVGIYAPTVGFATSQQRVAYVQGLAKAIEARVGTPVQGRSFTSMGGLRGAKVDFAIIPGQCQAVYRYRLLANAKVGGGITRTWALYSSVGKSFMSLKGKKLAYIRTGCNDSGFIDNAMLDSEVPRSFFGGRVGRADLRGAIAQVATLRGAQAVFAPVGSGRGLTQVFTTGSVPNPAFVALNRKLSKSVISKVRAAVVGFGGRGAISSWSGANARVFRIGMGRRIKHGLMAAPTPVRVKANDVIIEPKTLDDTRVTSVKQHFEVPPARQE
jgi:hypothetical protein